MKKRIPLFENFVNKKKMHVDGYDYIVSNKSPKINDWVLKFVQADTWDFKSGALKQKDYQYFPLKVVALSLLNPEDLLIISTNNPKIKI